MMGKENEKRNLCGFNRNEMLQNLVQKKKKTTLVASKSSWSINWQNRKCTNGL